MKKLLSLSILVLFLSCSKKEVLKTDKTDTLNSEKTIANTFENDKRALFDLLNKLEDQSQYFEIPSSKPNLVKGKKGTIIHVIPNHLELENGTAITGNLKVELKELTNQKDLFRNDVQTLSDGKLLISGGSYFIDITANGKKVNLKKGKTLEVEFPKITNRNMELFYGSRDTLNQMNWKVGQAKFVTKNSKEKVLTDTESNTVEYISNDLNDFLTYSKSGTDEVDKKESNKVYETQAKIYESLKLSQLGWINCDAFYNNTTENYTITFKNTRALSFVKSFLIFEDINSLLDSYSDKNSNFQTTINLPLNQKVRIISISYTDDKFYAAEKNVTFSKNTSIEISLKEVSEKDIEKFFKT